MFIQQQLRKFKNKILVKNWKKILSNYDRAAVVAVNLNVANGALKMAQKVPR